MIYQYPLHPRFNDAQRYERGHESQENFGKKVVRVYGKIGRLTDRQTNRQTNHQRKYHTEIFAYVSLDLVSRTLTRPIGWISMDFPQNLFLELMQCQKRKFFDSAWQAEIGGWCET